MHPHHRDILDAVRLGWRGVDVPVQVPAGPQGANYGIAQDRVQSVIAQAHAQLRRPDNHREVNRRLSRAGLKLRGRLGSALRESCGAEGRQQSQDRDQKDGPDRSQNAMRCQVTKNLPSCSRVFRASCPKWNENFALERDPPVLSNLVNGLRGCRAQQLHPGKAGATLSAELM